MTQAPIWKCCFFSFLLVSVGDDAEDKNFIGAKVINVYEGKGFAKMFFITNRGTFEITCPLKVDMDLYLDIKVDGEAIEYGKFMEKFEIQSHNQGPIEEKTHDFITIRSLKFEKAAENCKDSEDMEKWELTHGKLAVALDWIRCHTPLETHEVELSATYGMVTPEENQVVEDDLL